MPSGIIVDAVLDGSGVVGDAVACGPAVADNIDESLVAVGLAAQIHDVDVVGIGVTVASGVAGRDHH